MRLGQPQILMDIPERSGGSYTPLSVRDRAQTFSREEVEKISDRSSTYRQEDKRWIDSYGAHVPDEYRRFLRELSAHIERKNKNYARSSDFFKSSFDLYEVSIRALQSWRSKGSDYKYISVASCQEFGAIPSNGFDTCMYFNFQQKQHLLKTAL